MDYTRAEAKDWAREHMRGVCNVIMPTFTSDIGGLNEVWRAYQQLGNAVGKAGPLDARAQRLVKLALAVGARSQGAVHSHARRGLREGIPTEELLQVPLLAISSIGWSAAMAALAWVRRRHRVRRVAHAPSPVAD